MDTKTERLVDKTEEPDKSNKETEQSQWDSPDDDEESTSTVMIIPRFGPCIERNCEGFHRKGQWNGS